MTAEPSTARELFDGVPYEPGAAKNDPILVADNVRRAFGGLVAVDVEHLEVQRGAITALIGEPLRADGPASRSSAVAGPSSSCCV